MTDEEYLSRILKSQDLDPKGPEMDALEEHRQAVEKLLRKSFGYTSTIKYGGSKAKGTMIKESYDLDIVNYFPHDDTTAGDTLEDIYNNTAQALEQDYFVERKGSALRLRDKNPKNKQVDFHIDVVPGRYFDETKTDTFLYRSTGEKKRLKTNLDIHITHVKESGAIEAIRLIKLWRVRNQVPLKNFILELLVIAILADWKRKPLSGQLIHVWEEFRDHSDTLSVKDPANPEGNDLSEVLNDYTRSMLCQIATSTLRQLENGGWEAVFGPADEIDKDSKLQALRGVAATLPASRKPYYEEKK